MNKSRPIYAPFRLDVSGRKHLVVTTEPALPEAVEMALADIEGWVVKRAGPGVQAPEQKNLRSYRAVPEMLSHLKHRIARETAGFRLYAIGSEAFIWDVHNLGIAAGLSGSEIFLTRAGPLLRRVYCTHCRSLIEDVDRTIVTCPGCGATLFVRDHFSRRLAAFMGVMVDAEIPGEVPAPEFFAT